jgi:hypothetical protein
MLRSKSEELIGNHKVYDAIQEVSHKLVLL